MEKEVLPPEDHVQIRCPRLGHQIHFAYCLKENNGLPCFKTLDCWHGLFAVEDYLRRILAPDTWDRVFGRPAKPKLLSLLELVEQARRNQKGT